MILHLFEANERNPEFDDQRPLSHLGQVPRSRYQVLANSDSTAVYSCDATGVITYFNNRAADLWGRRPAIGDTNERFCGSHLLYQIDGRFMPHDQCPMADVLAGRVSGIFDAEVQVERPDGSRVVVIVNIAPLINDGGVIVGAVNSFVERPPGKRQNGQEINGEREQQASS